jgi:hypothetical protein
MRPSTRLDCAFAVREAEDAIEASGSPLAEAVRLHDALQKEFQFELDVLAGGKRHLLRPESVYANVTGISGTPLNDSYHYGEYAANQLHFLGASDFLGRRLEMVGEPWRYCGKFGLQRR